MITFIKYENSEIREILQKTITYDYYFNHADCVSNSDFIPLSKSGRNPARMRGSFKTNICKFDYPGLFNFTLNGRRFTIGNSRLECESPQEPVMMLLIRNKKYKFSRDSRGNNVGVTLSSVATDYKLAVSSDFYFSSKYKQLTNKITELYIMKYMSVGIPVEFMRSKDMKRTEIYHSPIPNNVAMQFCDPHNLLYVFDDVCGFTPEFIQKCLNEQQEFQEEETEG